MEWYWILLFTTILVFHLYVFYRLSFIKGYKAGARHVIREWRKTLNEEEFNNGERIRKGYGTLSNATNFWSARNNSGKSDIND